MALGVAKLIPAGAVMPIAGAPPAPGARPLGCSFAPRCGYVTERCQQSPPPLIEVGREHLSACLHHARLAAETVTTP
jgi:oligopeptide/dipeptide ABC transporter ATP-binding protein